MIQKRRFSSARYPEYGHRITTRNESAGVAQSSREYVFEKATGPWKTLEKCEQDKVLKEQPSIKYEVYQKQTFSYPDCDTDEESSCYEDSSSESKDEESSEESSSNND